MGQSGKCMTGRNIRRKMYRQIKCITSVIVAFVLTSEIKPNMEWLMRMSLSDFPFRLILLHSSDSKSRAYWTYLGYLWANYWVILDGSVSLTTLMLCTRLIQYFLLISTHFVERVNYIITLACVWWRKVSSDAHWISMLLHSGLINIFSQACLGG